MAAARNGKAPRLEDLDLGVTLDRKSYEKRLAKLQHKLSQIQQAYLLRGHAGVIVFEGWDAAGKGGTIRRLSAALDPRSFKVWPIGAPRDYYLDRHFLLRFMERLPPSGAISAFDRSWYGRVLVERVEQLTPAKRWKAAYREINDFERMLVADGLRLVKLFFHISPEEQLARFEERVRDPMKRWKLTFEDFRNRRHWGEYEIAIKDMFAETSTTAAPWTVIPANDKKHARIAALSEIAKRLGQGIDLSPAPMDESVIAAARDNFDLEDALIASLSGRTE
ncbi:MAG: polyphosphate kinase [Pseudomonadota bacterium]